MATRPAEGRPPLRWAMLAGGLLTALVGAVLTLRPFSSLTVLVALVGAGAVLVGVSRFAQADGWSDRIVGVAYVVAAIVALAWPDASVRVLAVVVGLVLLVDGIADLSAGLSGRGPERAAAVLEGVATTLLGILALLWPSVTLLVVAVVFGIRTTWFGLRLVWAAARGRRLRDPASDVEPTRTRGRVRRAGRLGGAVATLGLALALAGLAVLLAQGRPVLDDFYTPPDDVPAEPGQVVRVESFDRAIPDGAVAWRVLYTTTRDDDVAAVASAIVVAPAETPDGPPPVIAWAHGTTGVDRACAPSVLEDPWEAGAFFVLDEVVDRGWALVATDYVGLGTEAPHPYLVGQPEARSVLDAVRAARQLDVVEVADDTVVWGHSQGGGAALWTGVVAPDYAPDVDLAGVAALAPASDLPGLVSNLSEIPGGSLFASYVVQGYADTYPDVALADYVVGSARPEFDALVGRCLAEPAALLSVLSSLTTDMSIFSDELDTGALRDRLEQNVPTGEIPAPLLVGQGETDPLVLPAVQAAWVQGRCDAGQEVDYRTYVDRDHVGVVAADSPLVPDLLAWTEERLAGAPPTPTCP